jgi:hypothetical protein
MSLGGVFLRGLGVHVGVEKATDHALVLGVVFRGLGLEEVDALAAEGQRDLHTLFAESQLGGRGQEVRNDLDRAQGLIRVFGFRVHKWPFPLRQ